MRSLKFRVWDKLYKRYVKPYAVCLDGRAIVITEPSNDLETLDSKRVNIEQYTGVKDMSGKKIYEGDIILVANHGRTPYKVIYQKGNCSFVCNNEYILDYCNLFKSFHKCYSVIGNVHENPELLEQEDAKD